MDQFIGPLLAFATGLAAMSDGLARLRKKLRIQSIARSKIASAAIGPVEISAQAIAHPKGEIVLSPLSGLPCVYYRLKILKRSQSKKSEWRVVHQEDSSHLAFAVRDETGQLWIYPQLAEIESKRKEVLHGGQYTIKMRDFLSAYQNYHWNGDPEDYRIEEEFFCPGDSIYGLGYLHPSENYLFGEQRERFHREVSRLKESPELMKKIDRNLDDKIDSAEWSQALDRLQSLVNEEIRNKRGGAILGFHPKHFFILSNWHESTIISHFGFFGWLKLLGGGLIVLATSLYIFVQIYY